MSLLTRFLLTALACCCHYSFAAAATTFLPIANRTDMVYDDLRGLLYVTAGTSIVRYDVNSDQFLSPITINTATSSLIGIDISPDRSTLSVAGGGSSASQNWIHQIDLETSGVTQVPFSRSFGESGTFTVAYGADGNLIVSSTYSGSGWVPLRHYDPATTTSTTVASVRQNTMLTASGSRNAIAIAESNISSGPVSYFDVATQTLLDGINTDRFTFEVGISAQGSQFAVPTYRGMHVYDDQFNLLGIVGTYADNGPIGVVYSPTQPVFYTSWYDWSSNSRAIRAFSSDNLQQIGTFDAFGAAAGKFDWVGNHAFDEGRLRISPDGRKLFATVDGGVTIIDVPEPSGLLLAAGALVTLAWCVRRRT